MLVRIKFPIILISLIILIASCAEFTPKTRTTHPTKRAPKYERPQTLSQKQDSPASPLINSGISKLENEELQEAEWKFEEAINLDPDYGPSYYWLARTRYRLEDIKGALNMLQKAETLLKRSHTWLDRVAKFKAFLLEQQS